MNHSPKSLPFSDDRARTNQKNVMFGLPLQQRLEKFTSRYQNFLPSIQPVFTQLWLLSSSLTFTTHSCERCAQKPAELQHFAAACIQRRCGDAFSIIQPARGGDLDTPLDLQAFAWCLYHVCLFCLTLRFLECNSFICGRQRHGFKSWPQGWGRCVQLNGSDGKPEACMSEAVACVAVAFDF